MRAVSARRSLRLAWAVNADVAKRERRGGVRGEHTQKCARMRRCRRWVFFPVYPPSSPCGAKSGRASQDRNESSLAKPLPRGANRARASAWPSGVARRGPRLEPCGRGGNGGTPRASRTRRRACAHCQRSRSRPARRSGSIRGPPCPNRRRKACVLCQALRARVGAPLAQLPQFRGRARVISSA